MDYKQRRIKNLQKTCNCGRIHYGSVCECEGIYNFNKTRKMICMDCGELFVHPRNHKCDYLKRYSA